MTSHSSNVNKIESSVGHVIGDILCSNVRQTESQSVIPAHVFSMLIILITGHHSDTLYWSNVGLAVHPGPRAEDAWSCC